MLGKILFPLLLLALFFTRAALADDNLLLNSDFNEDLAHWHGDCHIAYVRDNGTEGNAGDSDVKPALKINLLPHEVGVVSQDIIDHDKLTSLHFRVDILPSADFKPSQDDADYTHSLRYQKPGDSFQDAAEDALHVDFWMRFTPPWHYFLAAAVPGKWTVVATDAHGIGHHEERTIFFCVPPGQGALYLLHPAVNAIRKKDPATS
jgi:hypothetical protein